MSDPDDDAEAENHENRKAKTNPPGLPFAWVMHQ
eukprot:CAMPEP_0117073906 /NCGR_PEP_ID=MMETSP0472-20121206/52063_1 /TAXON_ID=693140 ORGANISM="Tiarina fusus, Strain LIS" /NCGR_SAMPLE_ID=MMETSP0472 /ASSEMBLY_ACC=CAM_ASM_000603 /LENGTH=33 /DNA_ID= /DNA_START= /DNA_END= /DNA_ORIENTATION=